MALSKLEHFESSITLINKLIEISGKQNMILVSLFDFKGEIYNNKGSGDEVIKNYEKALEVADKEYPILKEIRDQLKKK